MKEQFEEKEKDLLHTKKKEIIQKIAQETKKQGEISKLADDDESVLNQPSDDESVIDTSSDSESVVTTNQVTGTDNTNTTNTN